MQSETRKFVLGEISRLAFMITLPQLISAPISVIIIQLLTPANVVLDIMTILDFFVISFPLTLAVATITYMFQSDQANPVGIILIIIGAALLSNWLHSLISSSFPSIDVATAHQRNFDESDLPGSRGIGPLLNTAIRIVGIYWRQFGPVMFIQAVGIGIYVAVRYFKKTS